MDSRASLVIRSLGFVLLTLLALGQWRLALLAQGEFSSQQVSEPLSTYRSNPRMLTSQAKHRLKVDLDPVAAEPLYRAALIANPLYIPAWLGLAALRDEGGDHQAANAILDHVDRLADQVKRWRWDKALLAHQLQRRDILARDLAYIIKEIPGQPGRDALQLAFFLWPDPVELKERMGRENIAALFRFASQSRKVEAACALWPDFQALGVENEKKEVLAFLNLLISTDRLPLATEIWRRIFNPEALFFNGAFTAEPLQAAFGWRIATVKGSRWRLDPADREQAARALHVFFHGQENLDFSHIQQIVPLAAGQAYRLQGRWQSKALTTNQRPWVEVSGYKCKAPPVKSEMIAADQAWERFELRFRVPEDCGAMVVRIRRSPSTHIDNRLGGELWLTDFAITAVETTPPAGDGES